MANRQNPSTDGKVNGMWVQAWQLLQLGPHIDWFNASCNMTAPRIHRRASRGLLHLL